MAAGSLIGPSAQTPMDCASLAKSMLGFSIVVPMAAVSMRRLCKRGHFLQMHDLLVIGAIVVHHHQQRDLMVRRGPERARCVHQIAVAFDRDGKIPLSRLASAAPTAAGAP